MEEHPGQILTTRFLEPLGIHPSRLATGLGMNRSTISRLLAGTQPITPGMAARLGAYFGVPARWFLVMQANYDAAMLATQPEAVGGVTPLEVDPDVLITPQGVISLVNVEAPAPRLEEPTTVQFDNGSVALLSPR